MARTQPSDNNRLSGRKGVTKPNPRKDIPTELNELIIKKRLEGYRPVLMMDANGDYTRPKGDPDLLEFIQSAGLIEHYNEKSPTPISTFICGSKRLDYILVDPGLVDAIERIGYLESHEGTFSDHVYAYVNFTEAKLFQGLINRPVPVHTR